MDRIEGLRQAALDRTVCNDEFHYLFYKRYSEGRYESEYSRYADAFYYAFSELTPNVSRGELIVGEIENNLTDKQIEEWKTTVKPIVRARCIAAGGGQDSHMAIDYELLLSRGINGIIEELDKYLVSAEGERREFYSAAKTCLLAVKRHSERYSEHCARLAEGETNGERKKELLSLSEICARVPAEPAMGFHEALQSVHFVSYCLSLNPFRRGHQQFQLGRPDQYLYPYYKKDVEKGVLTAERAQLLLDCLGIQINMRVPSGLSSGYMVGGRDRSGTSVANELTEMLIQVVDDVRLVYPAVGLCYNGETPDSVLTRACESLLRGRSHPAIFNDDVIAKGLMAYGVPRDEAYNYIHSTCVEITPVASSNVWVASPYTNMAQLLLDTMSEEYVSFEAHVEKLFELLDSSIERNFEAENRNRKIRSENSMNPLLSCFVDDCISRGIDVERGGARYNWIMPSFVGMANVVDSLYAIKKLVYDDGKYTVRGLKEILDSNFEGNEELRDRVIRSLPKYGNDNDEIDGYFGMLTDHIVSECRKYTPMHSEGRLIPSVFCWVMHEEFGRKTGATPDGRSAGFPLGDGSGPCQGREMSGPTASILSSTKWDHHELIGGVAVNMKFSKSGATDTSLNAMRSLIKTFMVRGGFEMQMNVTDRETLKRAVERPEEYRDLVVRVGGYSDYFARLSPEMQQEVILRTEHQI